MNKVKETTKNALFAANNVSKVIQKGLRIIVPDEKRPARWVSQVIALKILRVNSQTK